MSQSQGVKHQEEEEKKETLQVLTKDEREAKDFYTQRIYDAYTIRETATKFFDGLTFTQDFYVNRDAANTYLRPKRNDDEVRVNTATTERKLDAVVNELLALNLKPEVRAFDQNDTELVGLGDDFNDLVRRTNEIERDDDLWYDAIRDILTQRSIFIEEYWCDYEVNDKRFGGKQTKHRIQRAEKRLISPLKVVLGDITIPARRFNTQPFFAMYDKVSLEEARAIYGNQPNWKYVKAGAGTMDWWGGDFVWRMGILKDNEVEIVKYRSYTDDEKMDIVNGVLMDEVGTPLESEHEGYNVCMFNLRPLDSTDFAYGKPLVASASTLQALENETIRLLIRKFRQAIEPPLAIKGKKVYSKDIWAAGAQTAGVSKNSFERLIDHDGVSQSEMAMFEKINGITEEFIGASNLTQGIPEGGSQTAEEIATLQRNATKQLGNLVLAIVRMKRDLTYNRIYTIIEKYTQPTGKRKNPLSGQIENVYRQFTISDATLEDGKQGKKILSFLDRDLSETEVTSLLNAEDGTGYEAQQEKIGNNVRIRTINVEKLREIPLFFYVVVNPEPRDSSALDKVTFKEDIADAVAISQITGRPIAGDKIIETFGQVKKRRDWFQQEAPLAPITGAEGGAGAMGGQSPQRPGMSAPTPSKSQTTPPTINTAMKQ